MSAAAAEHNPFASAAHLYTAAGWQGVLPIPARKKGAPPTGFTGDSGSFPTEVQLDGWRRDRPDGNIALRMPATVVGIDVDAYGGKPGGDTLADCLDRWGPLPPTWISTSRDDGTSGIRFYAIPAGVKLIGSLPGIEIIQRHHRYAVVSPSIHPEGRRYRWVDPDGCEVDVAHVTDLPPLPDAWLDGLRVDNKSATARHAARTGNTTTSPAVERALGRAITEMGGGGSRHDATLAGVGALARLEERGHPGASGAIDQLGALFVRAVEGDRSEREAAGEWERMVDGARNLAATTPAQIPRWDDRPTETAETITLPATPTTARERVLASAPTDSGEPWPPPVGFAAATPAPRFPLDALPGWVADQVHNVTRQIGCDPILPAIFGLGALSVASLGHLTIAVRTGQVDRSTGLYLVAAGPPSAGKSPALDLMMGPVRAHEDRTITQARRAVADYERHVAKLNKIRDGIDDVAAGAAIAELAELDTPPHGELITSDSTPERVASLLAENRERFAIVSDEAGALVVDRYGDRGAPKKLDIFLQAFTGEPVAVHRVKAPTIRLRRPLLAIVTGAQPEALAMALADPEWRTRGLGARFLTAVTTHRQTNVDIDRDVWDLEVGETYAAHLGTLARRWASWERPACLTIAHAGRQRFTEWALDLQQRGNGGDLDGEDGWVSKLRTATLRIAALFAAADHPDHPGAPDEITDEAVARAIAVAEYFVAEHVRELGDDTVDARRLLAWMVRQTAGCRAEGRATSPFVARRDIGRGGPRGLRNIDVNASPLGLLVEAGFIRPIVEGNAANMQVADLVKRAKGFEVHPEAGEAVSARQRATARDNGPGDDHETTRGAESVARVARVAEEGISDPLLIHSSQVAPPSPSSPCATRATRATETASHVVSHTSADEPTEEAPTAQNPPTDLDDLFGPPPPSHPDDT